MVIDLLGLFGGAVLSLPFSCECSADGLSQDIKSGVIYCDGSINNHSGYIILKATIRLEADVLCGRCAKEFKTQFSFETEQKLAQTLESGDKDNDEYILVPDGKLDIEEYIKDSAMLEMPARFLCSDNCKGLCPKCGQNLNNSRCSCDTRDIDPRLAVLKDYFND